MDSLDSPERVLVLVRPCFKRQYQGMELTLLQIFQRGRCQTQRRAIRSIDDGARVLIAEVKHGSVHARAFVAEVAVGPGRCG